VRRETALIFLVALAVRLLFLVVSHSAEEARGVAWDWGYEQACIGESIAHGDGFAGQWTRPTEPFALGSGPTAWLTPVYPSLLASLMRVFGGVQPATAIALFTLHSLLAAATCLLLWGLGRNLGEDRAGRLAAWIFALYPASIWNATTKVWDTTLIAFALVGFVFLLFRNGFCAPIRRCFAFGLLFGVVLWINPAPVSIVPAVLAMLVIGRRSWRTRAAACAAFSGAVLLVCLPWMWRNQREIGSFSMRANLGIEMMAGNNDQADGYHQQSLHPGHNPELFLRYRELGEVGYASWAMSQARAWIEANPLRFLDLTLHRVQIFWFGENPYVDPRLDHGMRAYQDPKSWIKWAQHLSAGLLCLVGALWYASRSRAGRILLAILLLFPVPYYLTHFLERYRFPIEPLIVFSCAWLAIHSLDAFRAWRHVSVRRAAAHARVQRSR
jgi:4-amino-4-deoxy-L-arabinose transferase-like glycosyltransferase